MIILRLKDKKINKVVWKGFYKNMRKYGVPYKGSKNGIAEKIVNVLPSGGTLYDIFAGGCAISHCAMLKNKFKNYVLNDLNDVPNLFLRALLNGEKFSTDWVSREEFFARKDNDPFVRMLWSFGNDTKTYLYGREIEPYKKALHYAVMYNDYTNFAKLCPEVYDYVKDNLSKIDVSETSTRRKEIGRLIVQGLKNNGDAEIIETHPLYKHIKRKNNGLGRIQSLENLERLQSLENLERLQSLQNLENVKVYQKDYKDIEFTDPTGVIYCDIPYKGTSAYTKEGFNHEEFYDWCSKQTLPTFISEYNMSEDMFTCIAQFPKRNILSSTTNIPVIEKLYIPKHQSLDW